MPAFGSNVYKQNGYMYVKRDGLVVEFPAPRFGYECTIHTAMKISDKTGTGKLNIWDNGSMYDSRVFAGTFELDHTQASNLQEFFSTQTYARGKSVGLYAGRGIFPFGTDYGDERRFTVRLLDAEWGGANIKPWEKFIVDLSFVLVEKSPYTLPSAQTQGNNVQIASVSGFRMPDNWYKPDRQYGITTKRAHGIGRYHATMNQPASADKAYTSMDIESNQSLSAHLLNEVTSVVRGSEFDVTCHMENSHFVGADMEDTDGRGIYVCKLAQNTITMQHISPARFRAELSVCILEHHPYGSKSSSSYSVYSASSSCRSSYSLSSSLSSGSSVSIISLSSVSSSSCNSSLSSSALC